MPTYSYRCTECATAFDIQQAFTDDALTVCPACGGRLRKQYGSVGVTFNGSGFYRTDSRAKPADGAKKSEGAAAKSESTSGSSTSGSSTSTKSGSGSTTSTASGSGSGSSS